MKINKKYIIGTGVLIIFIILLNSVSAFSMGSAYHKDNSLELSVGETKDVIFNLQNMAGSEDISARMGISIGSEILKLDNPDEIYSIPLGGEIDIIVKASLPADAKIGDIYPAQVAVTTVTVGETGAFGFGSSIARNFNIIVVPTAEERARLAEQPIAPWIIYLIIGIIILMAVILFFWSRLKKRKK